MQQWKQTQATKSTKRIRNTAQCYSDVSSLASKKFKKSENQSKGKLCFTGPKAKAGRRILLDTQPIDLPVPILISPA